MNLTKVLQYPNDHYVNNGTLVNNNNTETAILILRDHIIGRVTAERLSWMSSLQVHFYWSIGRNVHFIVGEKKNQLCKQFTYTVLTPSILFFLSSALHNHIRIVFKDMSSWTPLTMHLGMKTTFETKYIQSEHVRLLLWVIK